MAGNRGETTADAQAIETVVPNRQCASFRADYGKRREIGGRFGITAWEPQRPLKPVKRQYFLRN